jgi:hypothetical protein
METRMFEPDATWIEALTVCHYDPEGQLGAKRPVPLARLGLRVSLPTMTRRELSTGTFDSRLVIAYTTSENGAVSAA